MAWRQAATQGSGPSSRWGHAACSIGNRLYVHGGHDGQRMLADLFVLDADTLTWTPLICTAPPSPRAGHTLTAIEPDRLLLFGGGDGTRILNDLYILDIEARTWSHPPIIGTAPAARCAHSANVFEGKLIVFGGGDGNRRFKDLYLVDSDYLLRAELAAMSKRQQLQPKLPVVVKEGPKGPGSGNNSLRQSVDEEKLPKDVPTWLNSIGMRKYVDKFAKEEIDMTVLPMLTEAHLERMGIPTIGARLHLLAAIAQLRKHTDERSLTPVLTTLSEATSQLVKILNTRSAFSETNSPRASLRGSDGAMGEKRASYDSNGINGKDNTVVGPDMTTSSPSLPMPAPIPIAVAIVPVPVPPPVPRAPLKGSHPPRSPMAKQQNGMIGTQPAGIMPIPGQGGIIEQKAPDSPLAAPSIKPSPVPFVPLPAPFPLPGIRGP